MQLTVNDPIRFHRFANNPFRKSEGGFATLRIQQTVDHSKLFAITFALDVCAAIFVADRK
ncbi:hypothetical protein [Paraburkholderia metrosideri]|uniref:Uncharacterized protein n=1 Tax=Paraburkholderia metrosideri TaxID=580937 RepID=A0ABM8NX44_9BURK|nr:hypothetical protein [Paraburkholderia metrosideri]CAD6547491.1 hypothetical protein LMG28140_04488 [Paraburkholderia metrosideri]